MVVMIVKPEIAYCMNLDSRTDRWEQIQKDFQKLTDLSGITIERVSAIKEQQRPPLGVHKTFKSIIQMAKDKDLEYVLILEDDCFVIEAQPVVDALNNAPEDWDLLLGGAYYYKIQSEYNEYWKKVNRFCSLHFIVVHSRVYDTILNIPDNRGHLDITLSGMTNCIRDPRMIRNRGDLSSKKLQTYLIHPMPCQQRPGFSDLRKKDVNDNNRKLEWIDSPNTFK